MVLLSNIPVTNSLPSFFAPIEALNEQANIAFGLMLETTCQTSQEQLSLGQRQQMIRWLLEFLRQRGVSKKDEKRKS